MRDSLPRIDVHVHLAGSGCCNSGIWLSPKFRSRYTFQLIKLLYGISNAKLKTTADTDWVAMVHKLVSESTIDYAVVLGFDGVFHAGHFDKQQSQLMIPPSWVFKACRENSGLLPGPSINPFRSDAMALLQECVDGGAVLIKWLPSAQGIDPSDSRIGEFYRGLAKARVPLLVHTGGERTFASLRPEYNEIDRLIPALEAGVTVICAHSATWIRGGGESDQLPRLRSLLKAYPHLWVDNSGLCNPGRSQHVPILARDELIVERTLYGSDWPVPINSFYFLKQLGARKVWNLERIKNLIDRDIAIKREFGYPDATHTNAHRVLANLGRWISSPLPPHCV